MTYLDGRADSGDGTGGPQWIVEAPGRGRVRLDATTCKLRPRERLVPLPIALSAVPGAPQDVDPGALLATAREQAGLADDALLLEIDAHGVKANGRVDLGAVDGTITYTFADPPGTPRRRWREVRVTAEGIPSVSMDNDVMPLPARLTGPVSPPTCTFADAYRTLGAEAGNAPARVVYVADAVSAKRGEFRIELGASGIRKRVADAECSGLARAK